MKIALISPAIDRQISQRIKKFFALYRTTLPYLASFFPIESEIYVVEETVDGRTDVPGLIQKGVDFVGISPQTASAMRGYEIAREFKAKGVFVAMGGIHVSKLPHEALAYCDAVVVGEAETALPRIIADYRMGKFRSVLDDKDRIYKSTLLPDLRKLGRPRWELMDKSVVNYALTVEIGRGCPHSCDFCSVQGMFGKKHRFRPVDEIVREIVDLKAKRVLFATDNLSANKQFARNLFEAVRPLGIKWTAQATLDFANDEKLLALAWQSGCKVINIGFESLSQESLDSANKSSNIRADYYDVVNRLHDSGIAVGGSFIFGFDDDEEGIGEETANFCVKSKMDSVSAHILTPYPGTAVFKRLSGEKRLIHCSFPQDWRKYDTTRVVFKPKKMSVDRLQEEYNLFLRNFFSFSSIAKRVRIMERSPIDLITYLGVNTYNWVRTFDKGRGKYVS
jgi:radical SAM superfamily enzyme YgiQ (UPF0313 family)